MARWLRRFGSFVLALGLVVWLPIYPRRNMVRSFMAHGGGDEISWEWDFGSVPELGEYLRYARPEEHAELFVPLDVVLALLIAALLTVAAELALSSVLRRRKGN